MLGCLCVCACVLGCLCVCVCAYVLGCLCVCMYVGVLVCAMQQTFFKGQFKSDQMPLLEEVKVVATNTTTVNLK